MTYSKYKTYSDGAILPAADLNNSEDTTFTALNDLLTKHDSLNKLTNKGDLLGHTGSVYGRLGAGVDGLFLTTDSSESLGIKWASISFGSMPTGSYIHLSGSSVPTGYLACDGSLVSISTYNALASYWYTSFGTCCPYGLGSSTSVTVDSGTDTITWTSHGLSDGDTVYFTATTIPAGLTAKYPYYVRDVTANTFKVAATVGGAAIDITSNGTAVLGYKQFKLPDLRGKFLRGWANGSSNDPDRGSRTDRGDGTTGDYVGTNQADEFKSHDHDFTGAVGAYGVGPGWGTGASGAKYFAAKGGNETRPINMTALFAIKY